MPKKSSNDKGQEEVPLTDVLDRNILALIELRRAAKRNLSFHMKLIGFIVNIISSITFVYVHVAALLVWGVFHFGCFGVRAHASWSFTRLTGIASLEAIFLSSFVLINQRSMSKLVEHREDLDLQVNLITEHEITRILKVVDLIAVALKIDISSKVPDLEDSKKDLSPGMVLSRIEKVNDDVSDSESEKK